MNKISKELNIGRAGQFLTVADLLMRNVQAYLTDEGVNYDVVADVDGRLIRLQVKTTQKMRVLRQSANPIYFFNIRRAGKNGKREYEIGEFDGFALVALDIREVFYLIFDGSVGSASICIRDKNVKYYGRHNSAKKSGLYYQNLTWDSFIAKFTGNDHIRESDGVKWSELKSSKVV